MSLQNAVFSDVDRSDMCCSIPCPSWLLTGTLGKHQDPEFTRMFISSVGSMSCRSTFPSDLGALKLVGSGFPGILRKTVVDNQRGSSVRFNRLSVQRGCIAS